MESLSWEDIFIILKLIIKESSIMFLFLSWIGRRCLVVTKFHEECVRWFINFPVHFEPVIKLVLRHNYILISFKTKFLHYLLVFYSSFRHFSLLILLCDLLLEN